MRSDTGRDFLLFFFLFISLGLQRCVSQNDGAILFKKKIEYQDLHFFNDLGELNNGILFFYPKFKHLDNLSLDSIRYKSDGLEIFDYIIKPSTGTNLPCIIYNRGGNRDFSPLTTKMMIYGLSEIAKRGFIIIASSYRGNKKTKGTDEFGGKDVHDVLRLIKVLQELPEADSTRIGMYGWSRGGLMTYLALKKTSAIKAAVIGGSPTDLAKVAANRPQFEHNVLAETIPNYKNNKEKELFDRSPIKWPELLAPIPLLIVHGGKDDRVSSDHAVNMAKMLKDLDRPCKLVVFDDSDHTITQHKAELNELVVEWFLEHLY